MASPSQRQTGRFSTERREMKTIYESMDPKQGTHVVISSDPTKERPNPFVEAASTVATGEPVHNPQMEAMLSKTQETLHKEREGVYPGKLDERGQRLAADVEGLVESGQRFLREKNEGEPLQHMLQHGALGARSSRLQWQAELNRPENEQLMAELRELYASIRNLFWTLARSGEFRDIATDTMELLRHGITEAQQLVRTEEHPVEAMKEKVQQTVSGMTAGAAATTGTTFPATIPTGPSAMEKEEERITAAIRETTISGTTLPTSTGGTFLGTTYGTGYETGYQAPVPSTSEVPQQVQSQLYNDYIKILRRLSVNPDYQNTIDHLFNITDHFNRRMRTGSVGKRDEYFDYVMEDALIFIERFTGRHELEKWRKSFWSLYEELGHDTELQDLLTSLRTFTTESLRAPDTLDSPERQEQLRLLFERLRTKMMSGYYRYKFEKLFDRTRILLENIREDSTTQDFQRRLQKFMQDFALNPQGKPDLWVIDDSLHQLKYILLPIFKEHLQRIPIDRIEVFSPKLDARIEDLVFSGTDFLPEHVDMSIKNMASMEMTTADVAKTAAILKLKATRIKPRFHQMKFWYRRKAFPKIEDYGVADIDFYGQGMKITVLWKLVSKIGHPAYAHLSEVKCTIDKMNIHIRGSETKHNILDKMAVALLTGRIKRRLAAAIAEYLGTTLVKMDRTINSWLEGRPLDRIMDTANRGFQQGAESITSALHTTESKLQSTMSQPTTTTATSTTTPAPVTTTTAPVSTTSTGQYAYKGPIEEPAAALQETLQFTEVQAEYGTFGQGDPVGQPSEPFRRV